MVGSALLLRAVARAGLLTVLHAGGVEGAADDLVADARQVADAPRSDEHDRVLLQVVPDARDVRGDLDLRGKPNARDLAQRRVRLLGGGGVDARADASPLGRALQRRSLGLGGRALPTVPDELLDGGHGPLVCTLDLSTVLVARRRRAR